jgi:hypothetical protein
VATLAELERLALDANALTHRFAAPAAAATVVAGARALVKAAKAAGLQCVRIHERSGYDCTDPLTNALFQVRVHKQGALAGAWASVHGIDRARRPSSKAETPLARITRERDALRSDLERCRRDGQAIRPLF